MTYKQAAEILHRIKERAIELRSECFRVEPSEITLIILEARLKGMGEAADIIKEVMDDEGGK